MVVLVYLFVVVIIANQPTLFSPSSMTEVQEGDKEGGEQEEQQEG